MAYGTRRFDQNSAKCEGEEVMDYMKEHWKWIVGVWVVVAICLIVALFN